MLETILKLIEEANDLEKLEEIKKEYIGKKGKISLEMRNLKDLEPEERKAKGKELGAMKMIVTKKITEKIDDIYILENNKQLEKEIVDITSIGKTLHRGHFSKIQIVIRELENIFQVLSFDIIYENEIIDKIEDGTETAILLGEKMLRTYLSIGIEDEIKNADTSIKKVIIGKVYNKNLENSKQDPVTWKVEGIISDKEINLSNIFDTIKQISTELLGENTELRFRPGNLPYADSGIIGEISCSNCKQEGCEICSNTGWIDIFGIGNIENPHQDTNTFIFSIDITKLTAVKYTIKDTSLFQSGDLRFARS